MKKILPFVVALAMGAFLSACDNPISMRTVVHEDGSLDKNITLLKTDSARALRNPFGISASSGWHVVTERLRDSSESKPRYRISFDKHFDHVDAMNTELDTRADTLFQIHSNLDIRFRWFYTYMTYRETIRPVNRFKGVPASDFFTREDSLFVERLPAEGKRITRADSLQLDMLNEKISERFVNRALFQESYDILAAVVKRHAEPRWLDTLAKYKSELYQYIEKKKGEPTLARDAADTLGIPLPAAADKDFEEFSKDLNSRVSFMSFAQDGKYENAIEVPWSITYTNADSVAGSLAIWKPLVNKFVFRDYIMTVECRKLNWWAVVATLFLLAASGWLWFRKPE